VKTKAAFLIKRSLNFQIMDTTALSMMARLLSIHGSGGVRLAIWDTTYAAVSYHKYCFLSFCGFASAKKVSVSISDGN
jgi:hypothetical protein